MTTITDNLANVRARVRHAVEKYHRDPNSVILIAVSKTKPVIALQEAVDAGQTVFGENYVQEAIAKQQQLIQSNLEWHFIGPIQSNKTRLLAENFNWVHSIDRKKVAQRLNDQRPERLRPMNVLLQVNISDETSKSGAAINDLKTLVESVRIMPRLHLRGLMAIPLQTPVFEEQRRVFRRVAQLQDELNRELNLELDCLSMGMSGDMEAAIAEGATHIRIGTDIFGARSYMKGSAVDEK